MKDKISILIHGYNKNQRDMQVLARHLEKLNHQCFLVNLPLTFKQIEYASVIFEEKFEKILRNIDEDKKINLIGHSTGGIIIRKFLGNTKYVERIDKCILIATPNQGSELADMTARYFNFGTKIFKTLNSLKSDHIKKIEDMKHEEIKIGAIAGNKSKSLLGKLLKGENDGRVQVNSVLHHILDDFIILAYEHKEIHYKWDTAKLADKFIMEGTFK
ncbi:lipase family alpha/beta hydrolase [Marinisporobacter balticus]|uniref:Putative serine esterase DUF676 n=1 Tax=Marinisporobacter balticus TaxID=2018667 RepID=A0A4R2LIQ0_9FIRM|nr:alpha/beta fold hydrolase [Marinisporobacter balticus]TCO79215.1 putative serine esterase DUF676 [Marinisporobacter balticus]